jgi:hypothetical protein
LINTPFIIKPSGQPSKKIKSGKTEIIENDLHGLIATLTDADSPMTTVLTPSAIDSPKTNGATPSAITEIAESIGTAMDMNNSITTPEVEQVDTTTESNIETSEEPTLSETR